MVILSLNITTSFCCLAFSAARLHLTVVIFPVYICNRAQKQEGSTKHCPQENLVGIILILNKHDQKTDIIITYSTVQMLLANPPSLNPRPNFFNTCKLISHFARALKKIPCPQSSVNSVGTLKDGYARNVSLPRAPRIQSTSHVTSHGAVTCDGATPLNSTPLHSTSNEQVVMDA
jgi:hypothetical protein